MEKLTAFPKTVFLVVGAKYEDIIVNIQNEKKIFKIKYLGTMKKIIK